MRSIAVRFTMQLRGTGERKEEETEVESSQEFEPREWEVRDGGNGSILHDKRRVKKSITCRHKLADKMSQCVVIDSTAACVDNICGILSTVT